MPIGQSMPIVYRAHRPPTRSGPVYIAVFPATAFRKRSMLTTPKAWPSGHIRLRLVPDALSGAARSGLNKNGLGCPLTSLLLGPCEVVP